MAYGLLNYLNSLNDGMQVAIPPMEKLSVPIQTLGTPPPAPSTPMVASGLLNMPPTNAPVAPPVAPNSGSGFMDFIQSPSGKGLLYGAGMGLLAKMQDRNAPLVPTAFAAAEQFKQKEAMSQLGQQIASSNLSPEQKAFVQAAFQSGDATLINTAAKFLENAKPMNVAAGSTVIDPRTGKVIYQNNQANPLSHYRDERNKLTAWSSIPANQRQSLISQAAGMGYDPNYATKRLIEGATIEDLAKEKGLDPLNLPDPINPTTTAAMTQIQKRQQAVEEVNSLNPILTAAIKPYAQRFDGYSPVQIAEQIRGDNPDAQARFFAARALMPEMTALRARAMGANVGIETLREITQASMGNIKAFESLISPEVYAKANEYVDKWLIEAVNKANKVGLRPGLANQGNVNLNLGVNNATLGGNSSLDQMAQQAIANGADPVAVNARLQELRSQQNGG